MTVPSFIPNGFKGRMAEVQGADLVIVIVDGTQIPTRVMATVDDITSEITGVTDSRLAATGVFNTVGDMVEGSFAELGLTADTDGAAEIVGWWVAKGTLGDPDTDLELVSWNRVATGPGNEAWSIETEATDDDGGTVFTRDRDTDPIDAEGGVATVAGLGPDETGDIDAEQLADELAPHLPSGGSVPSGAVPAVTTATVADVKAKYLAGHETIQVTDGTTVTVDLPAAPTDTTGRRFELVVTGLDPTALTWTADGVGGKVIRHADIDLTGSDVYQWTCVPFDGGGGNYSWVLSPSTDGAGGGGASESYVDDAVATVVGGAPAGGDTLYELDARIAVVEALGSLATDAELIAAVAALIGSADSDGDTLGELQALIGVRLLTASNLSDVPNKGTARTNLGLAIGSDVQAHDGDLDAIAALTTTSYGRALLTLANQAALQAAVGGWQTVTRRTLGSASASETFTGLSGYKYLRVRLAGSIDTTAAGSIAVRMRCNGDTGSNYYTNNNAAAAYLAVGTLPGNQTNTDRAGVIAVELNYVPGRWLTGYCDGTNLSSTASTGNAPANKLGLAYSGTTAGAVSSVELYPASNNFAAGTEFIVEGHA